MFADLQPKICAKTTSTYFWGFCIIRGLYKELISKDETLESTLPNLHFLFPHIHHLWKYSGPNYKICHYKMICQTENLIKPVDTGYQRISFVNYHYVNWPKYVYAEQLGTLLKFLVILIWLFNTNFVYTIQYTYFRCINGQFFLKKDLYENWPEIFDIFYVSEFSHCLKLKFLIYICDCNYVFMACKFPFTIFLEKANVGV